MLRLTGPAGGEWPIGAAGDPVEPDPAVEMMLHLSGRPSAVVDPGPLRDARGVF